MYVHLVLHYFISAIRDVSTVHVNTVRVKRPLEGIFIYCFDSYILTVKIRLFYNCCIKYHNVIDINFICLSKFTGT